MAKRRMGAERRRRRAEDKWFAGWHMRHYWDTTEEDIRVCFCCRREWSQIESMAGCDPEGLTSHSWVWMKRGER